MRRNWLALACVVLIVLISGIDIYYFNDGTDVPETKRKLFHFLFLLLVMGIGYLPFAKSPLKWTRQLWIASYSFVIVLILTTGALHKLFNLFGTAFMDEIFMIRVWFCSPLPFMVIVVLTRLKGFMNTGNR